jgi:hypothetical protein
VIHFELLRDKGILVITPDGPLEKADFERLASELDPFLAAQGRLAGLMIHAKSFPGWESLSAFLSHIEFVAGHHRQIDRIAVVTDSRILEMAPRIAGLFVRAKVRHFKFEERDRALTWFESGE